MSVLKEFSFESVSGLGKVYVRCHLPEDKSNIKAIFQMAHGMAEHSVRYDRFAEKLCEHGYAVFINDHIGHGKSVKNDDMLGYFGKKDGWANLVKDQRKLTELARKECPGVPLVMFGHSMGSFVCRAYTGKYHDVDAAVYCGTGGPNPAAGIGKAVATAVSKLKGEKHRSKLIDKMAFGTYNKNFQGKTDFDWLTRDEDEVDLYLEDKYCGFLFTAAGYHDLFSILNYISQKEWFESVPKELPVFLVAGDSDPVGDYGRGVKKVYDILKETGHNKAEIKLYPGARHEILNETNRDEVMDDIINFADKALNL